MMRGLGRVNNCTLLERSSSIPRMLFFCLFVCLFFFCLGTLVIYYLGSGVGGGSVGSGHFVCVRMKFIRPPHPYTLLAKIYPTFLPPKNRKIPPFGKIPLPHRRYINSAPFTFPFSPYFVQTGIVFTTFNKTLQISKSFPSTNNTFCSVI